MDRPKTAEEWADHFKGFMRQDTTVRIIKAAMAQARRQALEEAANLAAILDRDRGGEFLAEKIRALAEEGKNG